MERTLAENTVNKIGETVLIFGFVNSVRSHGKIMFFDVRDRSSIVQCVYQGTKLDLSVEDVVRIEGKVERRPEKMVNPKKKTGQIEIGVTQIQILSKSKELPFPIQGDGFDIDEEIRLKHRYLDLRRERLNTNIRLRSELVRKARKYLFSNDFIEIETPLLTKSTPEGSRDFLVPSRMQPGNFYALPQSPQQYKQLLMVAGFERYFQIARCLRDEDLRSDRGFEHTQIDIEISFTDREEVMKILEGLIVEIFEGLGQKIKEKPFPVFTYGEAMKKYGADKFDLRSPKDKQEKVNAFAWVVDFPFFKKDSLGKWTFTHNPFSSPKKENITDLLEMKNIGNILTTQYDLVCNGYEVGGGSIRAHDPKVLETVFMILGYSKDEIWQRFGHMLEAFSYGSPPHGGCAFGIERLMMMILNETSLREVVAFPMTAGGKTSVMDAPNTVDSKQLQELGLSIMNRKEFIFRNIKKILSDRRMEYKTFTHEAVYTSEQAAKIRNTNLHEGAKALLMIADKNPILIVLPADKKLDFKIIKTTFRIKDLRMATENEVKEITGTEIGAVPPFADLFGIPLFVDEGLFDNDNIIFNAGFHTKSIQMKSADYKKVIKAKIHKFTR